MLSFRENIPVILKIVERSGAKKIVDIGAGMGKFGMLIVEQYLSTKAAKVELSPTDDIVVDAIEDTEYFLNFRNGLLYRIYNRIYPKSVFDVLPVFEKEKYDLALLIDVVEHWEKEDALRLMREISKHTDIIVSTPQNPKMYKQHYYGDSRHHKTRWENSDFAEFKTDVYTNKLSHIIYIHKQ